MTTEEAITAQFYSFEKRGRGWQLWPDLVELEPAFQPFPGYYLPTGDDARMPTRLSSWVEKLHGGSVPQEGSVTFDDICLYYDQAQPDPFSDDSPIAESQVVLPSKGTMHRDALEGFLWSLKTVKFPLSFEIIGLADEIAIQFTCREPDLRLVRTNLRSYFPDSRVKETSGFLIKRWSDVDGGTARPVIVDFGLSHEFVIPLRFAGLSSIDTLTGIVGTLADVREAEIAVFQVQFQATQHEWANSALWATTDQAGKSMLAGAPDLPKDLNQKLSQPLFAAVFRVGALTQSHRRSWELVKAVGTAVASIYGRAGNAGSNELIPLSNDGYDEFDHEDDLLYRQTHRSGMILNAGELLSVVHLPAATLRSEKFRTHTAIQKAAPLVVVHPENKRGAVILGQNECDGTVQEVSLSVEQRTKHIHLLGATGSGKSTLMLNLIRQDMKLGNGLCVLDPHGDLIDDVTSRVPDERIDDVVLFDPSDSEFPVAFNILRANSELEKTLLASDLVATFRRLSTTWGDVIDAVLANAILAFMESDRGGTLFDLKRFLVEKPFREEFLETVPDEAIRYFWQHEFPLISGKPQSSILIRLDTFMRQRIIRNIVCQKATNLNFREIMDSKKILLVKLSQGAIGEENAYLLGTLLLAKLYQAALSRQDSSVRPFFSCYVDEFQHFVTPSMENILSGARKYNLGLVLAHQEFRQLQVRNPEVASSVLANCLTRICFRLGDADSEKFASGFAGFDAKSLQNLSVGEAIARVERAEFDFNLHTFAVSALERELSAQKTQRVVRHSRERYAGARAVVEIEIGGSWNAQPAPPRTLPTGSVPEATRQLEDEKAVTEESRRKRKSLPRAALGSNDLPSPTPLAHTDPTPTSPQHRYLQFLVKKIGESQGFIATVEKEVFGGVGRIDVALERADRRIACEIAVTNDPEHELQNIRKCLSAGYDTVALIAPDARHLTKIRKLVKDSLGETEIENVAFFSPEEFHLWLETLATQTPQTSQTVKGFKVSVNLKPVDESERTFRKKAISDVVFGALKKMKKPPNK